MPGEMPLSLAHTNSSVTVSRTRGGEAMKRHLESIGFVPGARVNVITQVRGQVIVEVKGARFGLNLQTARNVCVTP